MKIDESKNLIKKLGLGTAQFGLDYGINNEFGEVKIEEIQQILKYAKKQGIKLIDTAYQYGRSEEKLGKCNLEGFKIVTKLPSLTSEKGSVNKSLTTSLEKLNINSVFAYLVHNFSEFQSSSSLAEELLEVRENGLTENIGYSLYLEEELEWIIDNEIPVDIIQIPYSVFDRRFEHLFTECRNRNIQIHVRSVYLQGLVFKKPEDLEGKLSYFSNPIRQLNNISKEFGISVDRICLSFPLMNDEIDYVITGVDNFHQLQENVNSLNSPFRLELNETIKEVIDIKETELLLPYNWT